MPQLTNIEAVIAQVALSRLLGPKRRAVAAMRMRGLARVLNAHVEDYNAERVKLCEHYAEKNEDGTPKQEAGNYVITEQAAFEAALKELQAAPWDCPDALVLRVRDFDGPDVEPELLVALGDLLDESDVPATAGAAPN